MKHEYRPEPIGVTMALLHPGDAFPALTVPRLDGGDLHLPGDVAGRYGVILLYRGSWCPYCVAQLRAFTRASEALADVNATVVALSVDDADTTRALAERHRLTMPLGYGADAAAVAAATGAFVNRDPVHLQSTGFVLDPDGRVVVSVYSSGAIGRLVPEDVVGLVRYTEEHRAAH
jgi:peroxiredoxin